MKGRFLVSGMMIVLCSLSSGPSLSAQIDETPLAQVYVEGALKALHDGRWQDAEALLEQGTDFSSASSDLSYLKALVGFQRGQPLGTVLAALRQARETDRWQRYSAESAALLEAQALIQMRQFETAQQLLQSLFSTADVLYYQLTILALQNKQGSFTQLMWQAVQSYPLDPRFASLYFRYMQQNRPGSLDQPLVALLLSRLPVLQETDPGLAILALPFIQDSNERRRIIEEYQAHKADMLFVLPQALELGVIDERTAITELAVHQTIPVELIRQVWAQLRTEGSRRYFSETFSRYSGRITEDSDRDGISEVVVEYNQGRIKTYRFDANQDRIDEIRITFEQGIPKEGAIAPYEGSLEARLSWKSYPLVEQCIAGTVTYIPGPASFSYAPFALTPIVGNYPEVTLLFPEREKLLPRLTERALVSFAAKIIRPGSLAKDSIETIELKNSLPLRSTETLQGRIISILDFSLGQPSIQRMDMDLDGRLETVRRFRKGMVQLDPVEALNYQQRYESIESDWDGDGIYEYRESIR